MAMLAGASEIVLPRWLNDFGSALRAYRQYVGGRSLLDQLLSPRVGHIFSVVALAIVILTCWRFRKAPARSREFQYTIACALAVTLIVIPMFAPYNQVLLLPAILLILREGRELWNKSRTSKGACALTVAGISWPWVASLGLLIASVWLSPESLERGWAVPLYTSLAIPFVLLIQLGSLTQEAWQKTIPAAAARLSES
jgi:hypothetical protein